MISKSKSGSVVGSIFLSFAYIFFTSPGILESILAFLCIPLIFSILSEAVVSAQVVKVDPSDMRPPADDSYNHDATTAVVIASRNEPFEVAKMTFESALALKTLATYKEIIVVDNSDLFWPDYTLWKSYVESFANDKAFKSTGTRVVFAHRDSIDGYKPKNLDIALEHVTAQFILYLDVDSTVIDETILRVIPMFDWDKSIGFVQLYTVPTNVHQSSSLAFAQAIRNYFLRFVTVLNTFSSHSLFYGHNAIWRTEVVEKIAGCLEYHRGEVVVTEDLSMSLRARHHGYYGIGAWIESGEWVPESMRETEAMWLRWTFGTYQVYEKHFKNLLKMKRLSVLECTGWLHHILILTNYGLIPVYALLGILLNSTWLMSMCLISLLPELLQFVCLIFKCSLGKMQRVEKIFYGYASFFVLGTFVNWVRWLGIVRFFTRRRQGWTPTGKSTEDEISFLRIVKTYYFYIGFSFVLVISALIALFSAEHGLVSSLLISGCGLYALNSLLFILFFGKSRMKSSASFAAENGGIDTMCNFY